jgi:hypothetical protein
MENRIFGDFIVLVASDVDREDLFVEVIRGNEIFGQTWRNPECGRTMLKVFGRSLGDDWELDLEDLLRALDAVRRKDRTIPPFPDASPGAE